MRLVVRLVGLVPRALAAIDPEVKPIFYSQISSTMDFSLYKLPTDLLKF